MSKLIELDENKYYGKGTHKKCFLHPENEDLCIKVAYNRGGQTDLQREINYLKILNKRNKDYSILPRYYGTVATNLGTGYVFELIKDFDGKKSLTLEDVLRNNTLFIILFNTIKILLISLKDTLLKNEIITMGIFPENIILQRTSASDFRIRIVNDMGSGVLIPLEYHFSYFAKTKVLRRWNEFIQTLSTQFNGHLIQNLIKEIK